MQGGVNRRNANTLAHSRQETQGQLGAARDLHEGPQKRARREASDLETPRLVVHANDGPVHMWEQGTPAPSTAVGGGSLGCIVNVWLGCRHGVQVVCVSDIGDAGAGLRMYGPRFGAGFWG